MRDPNPIEELRRRLVERGCSTKTVRHIVRETAEHLEDLQQAALRQGLPPTDAAKQAETQLGDPVKLAEQHTAVLRNASWWGRHPILGFAVLPVMSAPFLWILFMCSGMVFGMEVATGGNNWQAMQHGFANPENLPFAYAGIIATTFAGVALVSTFFCWLTRRAALGFRWTLITCVLISINALLLKFELVPPVAATCAALIFAYGWIPNGLSLGSAGIPLLIVGLAYVRLRRAALHS
jgi:hypothetical protein